MFFFHLKSLIKGFQMKKRNEGQTLNQGEWKFNDRCLRKMRKSAVSTHTRKDLSTGCCIMCENSNCHSFSKKLIDKSLLAIVQFFSYLAQYASKEDAYFFCWKRSALHVCTSEMKLEFYFLQQDIAEHSPATLNTQSLKGIELLAMK